MSLIGRCATCNGTGARVSMIGVHPDDPKPYACPDCGGTGKSEATLAEQLAGAVEALERLFDLELVASEASENEHGRAAIREAKAIVNHARGQSDAA